MKQAKEIELIRKHIDIKTVISEGWKVDKIKFKYILKKVEDGQALLSWIATDTRMTKMWESRDFKQCSKNFNLELNGATVYIGLGSNQIKGNFEEHQKTLILEFNPQKVNPYKEIEYLKELLHLELHRRDIMYIDMAYDMFIPIKDIKYTKRRENEYECKIGHKNLETIYLRKMGVNGTVRIYDKTLEMNGGSKEDIDEETGEIEPPPIYYGDCTRYEIRIKPGEYSKHMNIANPFLIDHLVKLHKIELHQQEQEEKVIEEIYKYTGNDFTNLLAVHVGAIKKLNNRAKAKYKLIYEDIKKSCSSTTKNNHKLNDFTTKSLANTLINYLNSTTLALNNAILIQELI